MCLVWLMLPAALTLAQSGTITPDETLRVTVGADAPVELRYNHADDAAAVQIIAQGIPGDDDTAPDTIIEVLTDDYERIAYADDRVLSDGEIDTDAQFSALMLPAAGTYIIRIDTFNGVTGGEVDVTLTTVDPFDTTQEETNTAQIVKGSLPELMPFRYVLNVAAGEMWQITARDTSGSLDPMLFMYDAAGDLIAANDDHETFDLTLNRLDAQLTVTAEDDATWTLELRDFMGQSGTFELQLTRVENP